MMSEDDIGVKVVVFGTVVYTDMRTEDDVIQKITQD